MRGGAISEEPRYGRAQHSPLAGTLIEEHFSLDSPKATSVRRFRLMNFCEVARSCRLYHSAASCETDENGRVTVVCASTSW